MSEKLPKLEILPPRRPLDPEKREQYIQGVRLHYEAGATIEQLMGLTGRGYTTIKTYLIESGTCLRHKRTAIHPQVREELRVDMRDRYEDGQTMRQIAEHHGYAESTVRTLLLEAKTNVRSNAGLNARQ